MKPSAANASGDAAGLDNYTGSKNGAGVFHSIIKLELCPISLAEANAFVRRFHRHNYSCPRNGGRLAVSVTAGSGLVGIGILARPVSRVLAQDIRTAEVVRVCVCPDAPTNACSMLYAALWRAWRAVGGRRLVSYTLQTEPGTSLRAAGFVAVAKVPGKTWNRRGRPRNDQAVFFLPKVRWELRRSSPG